MTFDFDAELSRLLRRNALLRRRLASKEYGESTTGRIVEEIATNEAGLSALQTILNTAGTRAPKKTASCAIMPEEAARCFHEPTRGADASRRAAPPCGGCSVDGATESAEGQLSDGGTSCPDGPPREPLLTSETETELNITFAPGKVRVNNRYAPLPLHPTGPNTTRVLAATWTSDSHIF